MLSYSASQIQLLSAGGVLTDIAGALILSRSFILSKPEELAAQQDVRWVGNPSFLKALSEQAVDAHWGGSLLGIGFLLQFFSNVGLTTSMIGFFVAVAILVFVIACYLIQRSRRVKATFLAAVDKMALSDDKKQIMRDLYPA